MDLHKEESQKTLRCAYGTWPPACLAQTRAFPAKLLCVGLESGKNMQEAPLEAEAYFRSVLSDKSCKVVVSVTYKQKGYTYCQGISKNKEGKHFLLTFTSDRLSLTLLLVSTQAGEKQPLSCACKRTPIQTRFLNISLLLVCTS